MLPGAGVAVVDKRRGVHIPACCASAPRGKYRPTHPLQQAGDGRDMRRVIVGVDRVGDDERPFRRALAGTVRHDDHAAVSASGRFGRRFGIAFHPDQHAGIRPSHPDPQALGGVGGSSG
jgi:hypothetical protein